MKGKDQSIRQSQMNEIKQFIKDKHIPKNEPVYIGGDLNVIKGSDEYQQMPDNLNVSLPTQFEGNPIVGILKATALQNIIILN